MDLSYFWCKLNLYRKKIIFSALVLLLLSLDSFGQLNKSINLPNSDSKKLHYGFLIGGHVSRFQLKYAKSFVANPDTLYSIDPVGSPGFAIGFLVNYKLFDYFDIMLLPSFGFYEYRLKYQFKNTTTKRNTQVDQVFTPTFIELSALVKYRAHRRKNARVYWVGGLRPYFQVTNKKNAETDNQLNTVKTGIALDYGVGIDIFYPMFKFSPELRFSHGLNNLLGSPASQYTKDIKSLTTHTVTLYLQFSD